MCIASGVIEFSAALIYFYRRGRGETVGYFDYEVIQDQTSKGTGGVHHGPDYH